MPDLEPTTGSPALDRLLDHVEDREAKTWKDLAQAAYKKQLASKEKAPKHA